MGRLAKRLLLWFLVLCGGYLALQAVLLARPDFTTETALFQRVSEEIHVFGYMLRTESPVTLQRVVSGADGGQVYLHYPNGSGKRVSPGGVLVSLYPSQQQLLDGLSATRLEQTVTQLDLLLARPGIGLSGVAEVDENIRELAFTLAQQSDMGNALSASDIKAGLAQQLTRRQMATGELQDPRQLRDSMASRLTELRAQLQGGQRVEADRSGYFIGMTDGYERIFDASLAGTLTAEQLAELAATPPEDTSGAVGKLVERYTWYFMCRIDDKQASQLHEGRSYRLRFAYDPTSDMPALLQRIYASGQDGYVLTFSGTRMTEEMMLLRSHDVSILLNDYEGLRINNEARRVVDGQPGVYVRSGLTLTFRPITVLYTADTYSIVKYEPGKPGTLKLYDEVVVTGKDIYDGRVVG